MISLSSMTSARVLSTLITVAFFTAFAPSLLHAQTGVVTGTVVDRLTQSPLGGVTILVAGSTKGAISKSDGRFTIRDIPAGIVRLRATLVGYDTVTVSDVAVSSGKPATVTVEMTESSVSVEEVLVTGDAFTRDQTTITSTQCLTSEEVRRAPGVQEDVVRAIALLPGVAVTQAGRNDLAVRGGAPFENLFLVDNIEVPNINHFGSQGSTGGPLSIINIDFVRDVSLSTGGFGPQYGDRLSSVTRIDLREGNTERFGGEINLSATGFGVIGEGPIGENGTFLFSARRSYLDLIFNLAGFGFKPEYWDFTGKIGYRLDQQNSITFLAIGALGTVSFNNDTEENLQSNARVAAPLQDQYFAGITWKHLFERGYVNTTLGRTFTKYRTTQQDTTGAIIFKSYSDEGENSLRSDLVYIPSSNLEINTGIIGKYASMLDYEVVMPGYARLDAQGQPAPLNADTNFTAARIGAYAQAIWSFAPQWSLSFGGRFDHYAFLDDGTRFAPRASLSYRMASNMTISASGGTYYQAPQYIWMIGDPSNGSALDPIRTDQGVLSFEWIAASDLKVQVETYLKSYSNYPGRVFRPQAVLAPGGFDDITTDIPFGLEPLSMTGTGSAYGVEFFVQKKLSEEIPVYGLASISINHTEFSGLDDSVRVGSFDTPIIATIAVGWRPSPLWELSSKFRAAEGLPFTPYITTDERAQQTGFPVGSLDFGFYNAGGRLPFFYALDVRADKRWFFEGWQLITYIDIQNITGRQNTSGYKYDYETQAVEAQTSIGVLPSIGVNIEF